MLSVAHSRFTIPTQFVFLIVNGVALFFGLIYNASTPDLYENNAHHKIGWIASSVVVAQFVIGIIYAYSGRRTKTSQYERAAFFPVSTQNMMEHQQLYTPVAEYRWSGDSGQGTSCPASPDEEHHNLTKPEEEEEDVEVSTPLARGWLRSAFLDRFFTSRVPGLVSNKVLRALRLVYSIIDRIILPFGFIALASGGITYGGIFVCTFNPYKRPATNFLQKAHSVFSGLAHFIKGGIFFWYGLVVLGRYMGCWANWGWSWNLKPANSRAPTGEFVESALIFTYGSTNVFLEHLGGWGKRWSPQDLEHVSISVMFFGAGLVRQFPQTLEDTANFVVWHAPRVKKSTKLVEAKHPRRLSQPIQRRRRAIERLFQPDAGIDHFLAWYDDGWTPTETNGLDNGPQTMGFSSVWCCYGSWCHLCLDLCPPANFVSSRSSTNRVDWCFLLDFRWFDLYAQCKSDNRHEREKRC